MKVHEIVTNATGLQLHNHEFIQIVKYEQGQYYRQHRDTSYHYTQFAQGHRVYTL
jgi:hypothetical protein